jgi:hypothetical protein
MGRDGSPVSSKFRLSSCVDLPDSADDNINGVYAIAPVTKKRS